MLKKRKQTIMAITYEYSEKDNLVYTKSVGILDMNDIKEYFTDLLRSEIIQNGFIEVVDLENVDDFTINFNDCFELRKIFKKLKDEKNYGGAVVYAPDVMVMSIAKLLSAVLDLVGISNINIVDDKNKINPLITMLRHT